MSKTIQIRNVTDRLHRRLKARASKAGMSQSSYLLAEIKEIADRPTMAEFCEMLRRREPVTAEIDAARIIREHRDAGL
jgi:antitoxin FitA